MTVPLQASIRSDHPHVAKPRQRNRRAPPHAASAARHRHVLTALRHRHRSDIIIIVFALNNSNRRHRLVREQPGDNKQERARGRGLDDALRRQPKAVQDRRAAIRLLFQRHGGHVRRADGGAVARGGVRCRCR